MGQIKEVKINNYKGIEDIQFPCGSINIIVGPNNTGKSSILESIIIAASSLNDFEDALGTKISSFFAYNERNLKYFIRQGVHESTTELKLSENNKLTLDIIHLKKGYPPEISDEFLNSINTISLDEILKSGYRHLLADESYINELFELHRKKRSLEIYAENDKTLNSIGGSVEIDLEEARDSISKQTTLIVEYYKNQLIMLEKIFLISKLDNEIIAVDMIIDTGEIPIVNKDSPSTHNIPLIVSLPEDRSYGILGLHTKLVKQKKIDAVLNLLKDRIPYFEDIREVDGELVVLLEDKNESVPLSFMGAGFKSLLKLSFMSPFAKDGVVIFEEPEISLHPGYFDILAREIVANSKNSQFFISTHSLELVKYIIKNAKKVDELESVNIIKLRRLSDGYIDREILSGVVAKEEMESIETDLRGY